MLDALLASKAFNVSVLTSNDTKTFPSGVSTVHKHDFNETSASADQQLQSILRGQDAVISAVGPTGFDGTQKKLISLAAKAGVKRFIPSEFSINTASEAVRQLIPLFQTKWEISQFLQEMEKEGLTWTALLTGLSFDFGLKIGILGFNLQEHAATIWDDGNTPASFTNIATIGQAIVSILQHPEETANRYIHIASFTTTQNEIFSELKAHSNAEWKTASTTTEEQISTGKQLVGQGDFMGMLMLVQAGAYGSKSGLKTDYEKDEELWNEKLGLPKESLRETVRKVLEV